MNDFEASVAPIRLQALRQCIYAALEAQPDKRTALQFARILDAGMWRIVAHLRVDDRGRLKPDTLCYRVDVRWCGQWADIVDAHWTWLGIEWIDVLAEVANVKRQHREGTYPGGPHDPFPVVDPTTN